MALLDLWNTTPDQLRDKQVHQLIAFAGNGKLLDDSTCCKEFRTFLASVPSKYLQSYADQCLANAFDGSGFALQDLVNEVGARLGANVASGRYRGTTKHVGQDGLWRFPTGRSIVVEVKTTDAYSINLNTIAGYRKALIASGDVVEEASSMLFVVGRQETDNLEAQIRGSKYAWNIRVISVDALLRLMFIKEELEDPALLKRIHAVLVPHEFTRLDSIAELLFSATKEFKQEGVESEAEPECTKDAGKMFTPVAFHEECISQLQKRLGISLVRRTRSGYSSPDNETGLVCSISKEHNPDGAPSYWFAFHPHQKEFLGSYKKRFVSFGCGSSKRILLIPYQAFEPWLANAGTTTNEDRTYWHILVFRKGESYSMRLRKGIPPVDLNPFVLSA